MPGRPPLRSVPGRAEQARSFTACGWHQARVRVPAAHFASTRPRIAVKDGHDPCEPSAQSRTCATHVPPSHPQQAQSNTRTRPSRGTANSGRTPGTAQPAAELAGHTNTDRRTEGDVATKSNPRRTNSAQRNRLRVRVLREETLCWLCGQSVDKTLPHGLPASPEIDEIVPVSKGGSPYERGNVRLAHRLCNQRRGNKTPSATTPPITRPAGPLRTSRQW